MWSGSTLPETAARRSTSPVQHERRCVVGKSGGNARARDEPLATFHGHGAGRLHSGSYRGRPLRPPNGSPNQLRAATRATERRGAAVAAPDKRLWKK